MTKILTNEFPPPPPKQVPATLASTPGSSGIEEKKIKDYAKGHRQKIVETLYDILIDGSDSNKIRAAEILAGYSDGKPKQETETTHTLTYQDLLTGIAQREQKYIAVTDVEVVAPLEIVRAPMIPPPKPPSWDDVL